MDIDAVKSQFAEVTAKSSLVGTNKLELLLFSLGSTETFGINVFKVKEVTSRQKITRMPNMQPGIAGVFSLRGNVLPALDLGYFTGMGDLPDNRRKAMIVTEYSQTMQGFIVESIDRIIRVDWDKVKTPKAMFSSASQSVGNKITSITETEDGRLVSILDVEQILFDAFGEEKMPSLHNFANKGVDWEGGAFFVDDSGIARKKIGELFDHMGIRNQFAENGKDAWDRLQAMAAAAEVSGTPLRNNLRLILTDAEMPEMDGYVLTKNIKGDQRFAGIPVVMYSSLSSQANRTMGMQVGVDGYVAKFESKCLAETIAARWAHD